MKSSILISGFFAAASLFSHNLVAAAPTTEMEKFSYALGYQIGQGFKRDSLEIDMDHLSQAISDVLQNREPQLSVVDMRSAMVTMQRKIEAREVQRALQAKADGEAFLSANKKKEGVTTLASGLQYKVIKSGSGKQPKATDSITAHYQGSLINGTVFDSSYQRGTPATFAVNQVIQGWQQVLPLMHEGDKWQVFIPSSLGYGESGAGSTIGPNETLLFDIELISVNP